MHAVDPEPAGETRPESALTSAEVSQCLLSLEGWAREGGAISRTFRFLNHYELMAFVNALAWISHRADHHPDLSIGYSECKVTYTTHSQNGLSRKDFVCAAKVDGLFSN